MDSEGIVSAAPRTPGGKQYKTLDATKFELIGPGTATIAQGVGGVIVVSAPQVDEEHIEVKLSGDSLKVEFRGGLLRNREPDGPIRYELTAPIVEELRLSGGLAAEVSNLDGKVLRIELKSGSNLTLAQIRTTELEAKVDDGSRLTASGTATQQKIRLAGKSTYQGGGLDSDEAEIDAAGGSEATARVIKKLKVKAESGSIVSYSGQHVDLTISTTGGAEFRQIHS
jgi:hypothetical protein